MRSHDERELIDIVISHAKNIHRVEDYKDSEVRTHMQTVGGPEPSAAPTSLGTSYAEAQVEST